MPTTKNVPVRTFFKKSKQARAALQEKAHEIVEMMMDNAKAAIAAGQHEAAAKSLQWLLEHMPADEEGTKVIEPSVDKQVKESKGGGGGPRINIGFQLGGLKQDGLPPPSVGVEVLDEPNE